MKLANSAFGDFLVRRRTHSNGFDAENRSKYEAARDLWEEAVRLNPFLIDAYILIGNSHIDLDDDMEEAIVWFNRALEVHPDSDLVLSARAAAYELMGEAALAKADRQRLIELDSPFANQPPATP
ncbi:MAG: hypothetical protein ACFB20_03110 [Opitutales bacterium]